MHQDRLPVQLPSKDPPFFFEMACNARAAGLGLGETERRLSAINAVAEIHVTIAVLHGERGPQAQSQPA